MDAGLSAAFFTSLVDVERFGEQVADDASFVLSVLSGLHRPAPQFTWSAPRTAVSYASALVPDDWSVPPRHQPAANAPGDAPTITVTLTELPPGSTAAGVGSVLWPAAESLARRLASYPHPEEGYIVELGAGCVGLPGIVSTLALSPARVVWCDHVPELLTQLRVNVDRNCRTPRTNVIRFDWTDLVCSSHPSETELALALPPELPRHQFDLVLAADVIYSDDDTQVQGVAAAISALLSRHAHARALMTYQPRWHSRQGLGRFRQCIARFGLQVVTAEWDRVAVPEGHVDILHLTMAHHDRDPGPLR
jgi:hypothetical protein